MVTPPPVNPSPLLPPRHSPALSGGVLKQMQAAGFEDALLVATEVTPVPMYVGGQYYVQGPSKALILR